MEDQPNGVQARILYLEREAQDAKAQIRRIDQMFPNRERCDRHDRELQAIDDRVKAIELTRVPALEWDRMKNDVLNLRFQHWKVGLITAAVVLLANVLLGVLIAQVVEQRVRDIPAHIEGRGTGRE